MIRLSVAVVPDTRTTAPRTTAPRTAWAFIVIQIAVALALFATIEAAWNCIRIRRWRNNLAHLAALLKKDVRIQSVYIEEAPIQRCSRFYVKYALARRGGGHFQR